MLRMSYVIADMLKNGMTTNDTVRRHRLVLLAAAAGGLQKLADLPAKKQSWAALDQVIKRTPLPAKADGSISQKSLGDRAARDLELATGHAPGWLDWPLDGVDFDKYSNLTEAQQNQLQGRMSLEMDQMLKTHVNLEVVKGNHSGQVAISPQTVKPNSSGLGEKYGLFDATPKGKNERNKNGKVQKPGTN
jgi:hypothetical protein